MAYLGIQGQACPKCGSNLTTEVHKPTNPPNHPKREIYLSCKQCGTETFQGIYTNIGGKIVKA